MNKIKDLDTRIEELKKEKELAELENEIKKIKKTVIEETVIKRVTRYEEMPVQLPTYPATIPYQVLYRTHT